MQRGLQQREGGSRFFRSSMFVAIITLAAVLLALHPIEVLSDDDLLEEMLAAERREAAAYQKMEDELRELEALKQRMLQEEKEAQRQRRPIQPRQQRESQYSKSMNNVAEQLRQQEVQARQQRRAEEEERRAADEAARELQMRREAQKRQEAAVAADEAALRKLKRQRKQDQRLVARVLRAAEAGQHYRVLGLRDYLLSGVSIPLPSFPLPTQFAQRLRTLYVKLVGLIPFLKRPNAKNASELGKDEKTKPKRQLTVLAVTKSDIKKAYRNMSRWVHPDKNQDERAPEAFRALEASASLLQDDDARVVYNLELRSKRLQRQRAVTDKISAVTNVIYGATSHITHFVWKRIIFGPFTTSIIILSALIL